MAIVTGTSGNDSRSGTTGADVSKIDLDASAAQLQAKALAATMQEVLGPRRLPMLIIDSKAVTRGSSFSARGAGVIGMMNFGRHHTFALDDDLHPREMSHPIRKPEDGGKPQ